MAIHLRNWARRSAFVIAVLAFGGTTAHSDEPQDANREDRLEFMQAEFASFEIRRTGTAEVRLSHTAAPVLRYSNPVRNFFSDGVVFLWLDDERPAAAASISIRGSGTVAREFSSFGNVPLKCVRGEQVIWSPRSGGLTDQRFEDGPKAARSSELRLTQMRQLARRFSADVRQPGADEWTALRLLPQPIYRWSEDDLDGALFALTLTNDPDVLLMIESDSSKTPEASNWQYSVARMSAPPVRVLLDGEQIWSVDGYWKNPRASDDPYIEIIGGSYADAGAATKPTSDRQ